MEMQKMARRGGRPAKVAAPGQRAVLGLRVRADIKNLLDATAKASGRTQAQEAERLIELGLAWEQQGRFTLPAELQHVAIELLAANAAGLLGIIHHVMERGSPGETERYYRAHAFYSAFETYLANHPIRKPEEKEPAMAPPAGVETQQSTDDEAA
jgi:hypothetical protein